MSTIAGKIKEEVVKALPPTIFFFVILHIVAVVRALMTRGTGIDVPSSASILVASLILGKSVLVADLLPFINRFPEKPLIWNVGWKTLMYSCVAVVLHYLERLYEFWRHAPGLVAANHALFDSMNWPRFWAIQILLVTLIFNYCVIAELARALGRGTLRKVFFGAPPLRD